MIFPDPADVCLIEHFDPAFDYQGKVLVALVPSAAYQLTQRGLPHFILEDFYSENELRAHEEKYFFEQLDWIKKMDQFLGERVTFVREHKISLFRLYFNRVKYFIDPVVIQAFILEKVLSRFSSSSTITYLKSEAAFKPRSMHEFKYSNDSCCFSDLLPAMCKKLNIRQCKVELAAPNRGDEMTVSGSRFKTCFQSFFNLAAGILRPFWLRFKFFKGFRSASRADGILFLHSGNLFIDPMIHNGAREGARLYLHADSKLYRLTGIAGQASVKLKNSGENTALRERYRSELKTASSALSEEAAGLFAWVNLCAGVDVTEYILPFFKYFLEITAPELLDTAVSLERYCLRNQIRFIVSHTSSDLTSKAALVAARLLSDVRTVGVQHGCDVFSDRVWHVTDLDSFDIYVTADQFSFAKFSHAVKQNAYIHPCQIHVSAHYLSYINQIPRHPQRRRRKVLYIPAKLSSHGRYFNMMVYPVNWYFEFQKKIFGYFASRSDCDFIYKHAVLHRKYAEESVIPYLESLHLSNVEILSGPTREHYHRSDAIIVDRPTTAFFEALATGQPTLGLCAEFSSGIVDADAKKDFGDCLQIFSDADDAIKKIDAFLNAQTPQNYQRSLEFPQEPFWTIFSKPRERS